MLSIIIPTYNERDNVRPLISRIIKSLGKESYEVIFIDDKSPDGTAQEIRSLSNPRIIIIEREKKAGLTSAVINGVQRARGDFIVVMDADLSHPPEIIPKMVATLKDSDLIIGSRSSVKDWPWHRRTISGGAATLARLFLGVKARDPLSGFFAARKKIFSRTRFRTRGFKMLLNILYDNRGLRIGENPYMFSDRVSGKTKLNLTEIMTYLGDLVRIRFG